MSKDVTLTVVFLFKQKTAYEMRSSDWSSDVCSSDLAGRPCASLQVKRAVIPWRIHRPGPACRIYLVGIWSSHLVDIAQLFLERLIRVPCKLGQFIKGAFGPTLATGAIVAFDKHDQCIG